MQLCIFLVFRLVSGVIVAPALLDCDAEICPTINHLPSFFCIRYQCMPSDSDRIFSPGLYFDLFVSHLKFNFVTCNLSCEVLSYILHKILLKFLRVCSPMYYLPEWFCYWADKNCCIINPYLESFTLIEDLHAYPQIHDPFFSCFAVVKRPAMIFIFHYRPDKIPKGDH